MQSHEEPFKNSFKNTKSPFYQATNGEATFWNILVHGLNSVVAYIELFVCARPWRWHHLYQPSILGLIYVLFSIVYYAAGGKGKDGDPYIYKVLDWSNAGEETELFWP